MPDLPSILVGVALLALVVFTIAQPLLDRRALRGDAVVERDRLIAERESVLISLRDLDFDFSTGKILEEDYRPQRSELMARGAAILKQLDALGDDADGASPSQAEAQIERAVEQARRHGPTGKRVNGETVKRKNGPLSGR